MNRKNQIIDSVAYIQKELKLGSSKKPRAHLIRSVLRQDLGMRYKKIVPIAWTANSHRNLILRQRFALAFLGIDLDKKVILDIDETWSCRSPLSIVCTQSRQQAPGARRPHGSSLAYSIY